MPERAAGSHLLQETDARNHYVVYVADIKPLGFEFVEIDFRVTDEAVERVRDLLANPSKWQPMVEKNYHLAKNISHTPCWLSFWSN